MFARCLLKASGWTCGSGWALDHWSRSSVDTDTATDTDIVAQYLPCQHFYADRPHLRFPTPTPLKGQCPEDRLTTELAVHGYKDELPDYGIDDTNDSIFSLCSLLSGPAAKAAAAQDGGAAPGSAASGLLLQAGGVLPPSVTAAAGLQQVGATADPAALCCWCPAQSWAGTPGPDCIGNHGREARWVPF